MKKCNIKVWKRQIPAEPPQNAPYIFLVPPEVLRKAWQPVRGAKVKHMLMTQSSLF